MALNEIQNGEASSSTKADEIATALEEAIAGGKLAPGTVLRQDQLAEEYSVSRTPVREALRRVAALGLVSFTPNRGVRVLALDREQWHEAYRVRAELDGLAAELAAARITEEQLAELALAEAEFADLTRRLEQPLRDAERTALTYSWLRANDRFHDLILRASGAELVSRMSKSVRQIVSGQRVWTPGSELARLHSASAEEHAAIATALRARSAAGARALARDHVLRAWRIVEVTLRESGQFPGDQDT